MTIQNKEVVINRVATLYKQIMKELGIKNSDHSQETHLRVARMMVNEQFRGLFDSPPEVKLFPVKNQNPVVIKDIEFYSMCAHHHLPFFGKASIVYKPDQFVAGLSKFPRMVEYLSSKPHVQEELTNEIASVLFGEIKPFFLLVKLEAQHLCVCSRGAKNNIITTTYSYMHEPTIREDYWYDIALKMINER